jgi:hypothetical protein
MAEQVAQDNTGSMTCELEVKDNATPQLLQRPTDFPVVLPSNRLGPAGPTPLSAAESPELADPNPGQTKPSFQHSPGISWRTRRACM